MRQTIWVAGLMKQEVKTFGTWQAEEVTDWLSCLGASVY